MTIIGVKGTERVLETVFTELTSEISIAIDMHDTPFNAARMLAKNYDMNS